MDDGETKMSAGNTQSIGYIGSLLSILTFLTLLGIFAPMIQESTGSAITSVSPNITIISIQNVSYNTAGVGTTIDARHVTDNILVSLFLIFPWMPVWMIALHIVIRIVLAVIIYLLVTELIP